MPEELTSEVFPRSQDVLVKRPLSRRQVLRSMAASAAVIGGVASLSACNEASTKVTILLLTGASGWPIKPIPSEVKAGAPARDQASKEVLLDYQKDHPNVSYKSTQIDISTQPQNLISAVSARTAPYIFGADGFGTGAAGRRGAIKDGLVYELTGYFNDGWSSLMADYAKPLFTNTYQQAGGKYYALPGDAVAPAWGFLIRYDVLQQYNISAPADTTTWSWDTLISVLKQLQAVAKKPAMPVPSWFNGFNFNSNLLDPDGSAFAGGGGLLGSVPHPGNDNQYHWRVNVTPWVSEWKERVDFWRQNTTGDNKAIDQSSSYDNLFGLMTLFSNGDYNAIPVFGFEVAFFPGAGGDLANKIKADPTLYDKYLTFVPLPLGSNGAWTPNSNASFGGISLPFYLKKEVADATVDLYKYMFYGDGFLNLRAKTYNKTKASTDAYDYMLGANKYNDYNPKLPKNLTLEGVYGSRFIKLMRSTAFRPVFPDLGAYLPQIEGKAGPTKDGHDALMDALKDPNVDIAGALKTYEDLSNSQAAGLPSDLTAADFKKGATAYYKAFDKYWKDHSPTFYNGDWKTYYNQYVLPALK